MGLCPCKSLIETVNNSDIRSDSCEIRLFFMYVTRRENGTLTDVHFVCHQRTHLRLEPPMVRAREDL